MINKINFMLICAAVIFAMGNDASAQQRSKKYKQTARKVQNVRVEINQGGYQPESFRLKKGIPARVTFIRKTEDECGREIVIPAYNIRRELPLNQAVVVNFTPKKAGSFNFACGMDMMRGKVIVQ